MRNSCDAEFRRSDEDEKNVIEAESSDLGKRN
jgi:hypothetical protein